MSIFKRLFQALRGKVQDIYQKRVFEIWKDPAAPEGQVPPGMACYSGGPRKVLYLRRFTLFRGWGYKLCIHQIFRSDEDADPHDHPWDFTTVVLRRPYLNESWGWDGNRRRGPSISMMPWLWPVRRPAEHTHRVLRLPHLEGPTWTLVLMSPMRRKWGFLTEKGWVYWRTYLGIPRDAPVGED